MNIYLKKLFLLSRFLWTSNWKWCKLCLTHKQSLGLSSCLFANWFRLGSWENLNIFMNTFVLRITQMSHFLRDQSPIKRHKIPRKWKAYIWLEDRQWLLIDSTNNDAARWIFERHHHFVDDLQITGTSHVSKWKLMNRKIDASWFQFVASFMHVFPSRLDDSSVWRISIEQTWRLKTVKISLPTFPSYLFHTSCKLHQTWAIPQLIHMALWFSWSQPQSERNYGFKLLCSIILRCEFC